MEKYLKKGNYKASLDRFLSLSEEVSLSIGAHFHPNSDCY